MVKNQMIHKFKIGDEVKAMPPTDKCYSITNHRLGWHGKITHITAGSSFSAITTKHKNALRKGREYGGLHSGYFALTNPENREVILTDL